MISCLAPRLSAISFIVVLLACGLADKRAVARETLQGAPEYALSISFDLAGQTMDGTARISLPSGTPLKLAGGPLPISSALLERTGQAPRIVRPTGDNAIVLPASDLEQVLFVTWTLTVPEHGAADNLIDPAGITLAGLWHPLPDRAMIFRLDALLPENFTAVSEAEESKHQSNGRGQNLFSAFFPHPVRNIHFVAGPYIVQERTLADGVVLSSYFFPEDRALADGYLDQAAGYLKRYAELIGPYPYRRYSIVENRLPTGYGMPTYTLLGQAVVRLPFIKDTSLGHEILHSWFGNSVHIDDTGGNWCEGLTTYLADHLYAADRGEGGTHRKEQLQRYAAYVPKDNSLALQAFKNASDRQPMARHIRAVGYDKGAMVFHMLRLRLGDDKFFAGLQRFYETMRFREASWDAVEENFAAASGESLVSFFDQWLTRTDNINFLIDTVDVSQVEGRSVITFILNQKSVEPYEFDLPIVVSTRTGESRHTIRISERDQEVKLTLDELPTEMALDPDYDLMRDLRPEEAAPTWSRFMGAADKTVVLPTKDTEQVYAPLLAVLREMNSKLITSDELAMADLAKGGFLFLGPSPHSLGLFADPGHTADGFTLDVRNNPLTPDQVMVLVTSASPEETAAVAHKLSHYGKYGFLSFLGGRNREKRIEPTARGLRLHLFQGPEGVRVPDIRSFEEIFAEVKQSRVVYVGEIHTDMSAHILQLQVLQALFQENPDLAIGLEMFPRSAQPVLDDYINGTIASEQEFLKKSNYFTVWSFDYRLYRELIGYAKRHRIPLIGLNIDKALVDQVFKDGHPDGLDDQQMAQVPVERALDLPGYRDRLAVAFAGHGSQGFTPDKMAGFVQAQALWDETMAETIVNYLNDHPGRRMLVIAGNGHVYKDTGIPPRVARRLDVRQSVLSSVSYGNTGRETGYRMDYLLFTRALELTPAPKLGVVLAVEEAAEDPARARVRIRQISPHGKAGESGLKEKDIILTVESQEVHDINDIKIALLDRKPGDKVRVKALREHDMLPDEKLEVSVELTAPTGMEGMGLMPPTHPK